MFSRSWRRPLVLAIGLLLFVAGFAFQLKTQNAFLWQFVTVLGVVALIIGWIWPFTLQRK